MDYGAVLKSLQAALPNLQSLYAFGSRVRGDATASSDLDLAVLVEGYVEPTTVFELAGTLADLVGCPVDLLDFRRASTIMQHQILTTGVCWWRKDFRVALYEAAIMSDKTELDAARRDLLSDIAKRGSIYGG